MDSINLVTQWQLGRVRWFDRRSGEGMIRDVNGKSIYVHYSAIDRHLTDGLNKDFYWRVLFPNQLVAMKVIEDSHFTQVDSVGPLNFIEHYKGEKC